MSRVLFLHGFMGSALNWGRVRSLLETKFQDQAIQTLAVDLLGHALRHPSSDEKAAGHEALVKDLEKQIQEFRPTHVIAHSFGFRPALLLGIKRPDLIPHLIVEDATPSISQPAHAYLMKVLDAPTPFRTREEAKDYFESHYGVQSALSRFCKRNIRSRTDGLADWRFDKGFLVRLLNEAVNHDLWQEWKDYTGVAELVYGEKSESVSPLLIEKMKEARPGLGVYEVKGAGHWIHSDQPESFVDLICSLVRINS